MSQRLSTPSSVIMYLESLSKIKKAVYRTLISCNDTRFSLFRTSFLDSKIFRVITFPLLASALVTLDWNKSVLVIIYKGEKWFYSFDVSIFPVPWQFIFFTHIWILKIIWLAFEDKFYWISFYLQKEKNGQFNNALFKHQGSHVSFSSLTASSNNNLHIHGIR